MKISHGAVLPLPPDEAFAFMADPVNWPLFVPSVRGWTRTTTEAGRGHARLTSVVLGRSMSMDLELSQWDPPRSFRYTVSQGGKPGNDDNRRMFQPVPGGTRLTGTTEIPARSGPAALLDRLQRRIAHQVFTRAMARLPAAAAQHGRRLRAADLRPERPAPVPTAGPPPDRVHAQALLGTRQRAEALAEPTRLTSSAAEPILFAVLALPPHEHR